MEREVKLEFAADRDVGTDAALRDILTLLDLRVDAPTEQVLESEFFDTPQFLLRQHGASLSVCRVGDNCVQSLKYCGASGDTLFEREDYETAVDAFGPDLHALSAAVPKSSPLSRLLKDPELSDHLSPVFRTTVMRKTWALKLPGGDNVELAVDGGKVIAAEQVRSFSELALELKRGDERHLGEIAIRLVDKIPLRLSMQSMSDRGYDMLMITNRSTTPAAPIRLKKRDTVQAAFCKIMRNCLGQVHANAPLVAAGNSPEGVHQMRVGLRRFRSALDLFEGVAASPEGLAEEVKWIANVLGHARDWHVLAHSTLSQVNVGDAERGALQEAKTAAISIEEARQADAAVAVKSPRFAHLMLKLEHWLLTVPCRDINDKAHEESLDACVTKYADRVLRKRHRKLTRRGRGLHKLDAPHRHRARIAAKKLRYATEFFADLFQPESMKPYRRVLAKLQDDLGWVNDMAVADGLLNHLEQHHRKAAAGASYARGFLAARVADDRPNQRKLWRRFRATSRPHPSRR